MWSRASILAYALLAGGCQSGSDDAGKTGTVTAAEAAETNQPKVFRSARAPLGHGNVSAGDVELLAPEAEFSEHTEYTRLAVLIDSVGREVGRSFAGWSGGLLELEVELTLLPNRPHRVAIRTEGELPDPLRDALQTALERLDTVNTGGPELGLRLSYRVRPAG